MGKLRHPRPRFHFGMAAQVPLVQQEYDQPGLKQQSRGNRMLSERYF